MAEPHSTKRSRTLRAVRSIALDCLRPPPVARHRSTADVESSCTGTARRSGRIGADLFDESSGTPPLQSRRTSATRADDELAAVGALPPNPTLTVK